MPGSPPVAPGRAGRVWSSSPPVVRRWPIPCCSENGLFPGRGEPGRRTVAGVGPGRGADGRGLASVAMTTGASTTGSGSGCGTGSGSGSGTGAVVGCGASAISTGGTATGTSAGTSALMASRTCRATIDSMLDDAVFTYSPIDVSLARSVLLSTPSSFASSETRTLATVLLQARVELGPVSCACSYVSTHRALMSISPLSDHVRAVSADDIGWIVVWQDNRTARGEQRHPVYQAKLALG